MSAGIFPTLHTDNAEGRNNKTGARQTMQLARYRSATGRKINDTGGNRKNCVQKNKYHTREIQNHVQKIVLPLAAGSNLAVGGKILTAEVLRIELIVVPLRPESE